MAERNKKKKRKEGTKKEKEGKQKSEYCKSKSTSLASCLRSGIPPATQAATWEPIPARKGDILCMLNKYKVDRNDNLLMRFYRVQNRLKV